MQTNQSVNNMQYWNSQHSVQQQQQQQQQSPNLNFTTYHQNAEPVYSFQSPSSDIYSNGASHANYGTISGGNSQDIYQYSPYSGDLLQPEEIFQLDQPIRSANVSSLNISSAASTSPPATLLDLGSGTIEPKSIAYNHNELSDSYYSLHDDNSTNSSHNNDNNCFYQNVNETVHLNNNNNNNTNMISMNAHHVESAAPQNTFEHTSTANYYCDSRAMNSAVTNRRYSKSDHHSFCQNDAISPVLISPSDSVHHPVCLEFQNAASSYSNNNNNNNLIVNNNNGSNYKGHKRKAIDLFAQENSQFNTYNHLPPHEYYGSDEHLAVTNLDLHHEINSHHHNNNNNNNSPIMSEYCNANDTAHQYPTYFNGEHHDLVQLTSNTYEISVVNSI